MAIGFNLPDPFESQKAELARRQKYAEALQQQAFQPIETSSYQGIQAPIPTTAVLAKLLAGLGGGMLQARAEQEGRELRQADVTKGQEFTKALGGAKTPEERQALALRAMGGEFGQRGQIIGAGEYQMAEARANKEAERAFRAEESAANRQARAEAAQAQMDLRREIAAGTQAGREAQIAQTGELARMRMESMTEREKAKAEAEAMKLPPNVVTTYQEARINERNAGDTANKMARHAENIEKGDLPLGAVNVKIYQARNMAGLSSPESNRFFEMMRDVDSAVNNILQAAKGTQTEGDALRARAQIMQNPNDEANVKSALRDIARMSAETQNIYRGTLNQLGARYRGLEHERLPEIRPAGQEPRGASAPAPGGALTPAEQRELDQLRARFPRAGQ